MADATPLKGCTRCGVPQPLASFPKRSRSKDGLAPWCKDCTRAYSRAHYERNREKRATQRKDWYAANREKRRDQIRAYRLANLDREREYQRERAAANPDERARLVREWRAANPERAAEVERQWRAANRDRLRDLKRTARAADPERFTEEARRRRALVRGVTVGEIDLDALWTGRCGICDLPMNRELKYPAPTEQVG